MLLHLALGCLNHPQKQLFTPSSRILQNEGYSPAKLLTLHLEFCLGFTERVTWDEVIAPVRFGEAYLGMVPLGLEVGICFVVVCV